MDEDEETPAVVEGDDIVADTVIVEGDAAPDAEASGDGALAVNDEHFETNVDESVNIVIVNAEESDEPDDTPHHFHNCPECLAAMQEIVTPAVHEAGSDEGASSGEEGEGGEGGEPLDGSTVIVDDAAPVGGADKTKTEPETSEESGRKSPARGLRRRV